MTTPKRRTTTQRTAIVGELSGTEEFRSAQDLYAALRTGGSTIGLATVYRALQDLAADGDLDTVRTDTGEVLYRLCGAADHHHHLVCRICGRTQELSAPMVEQWASTVAQQFGYVDIEHRIELFGRCAQCAAG